MDDAKFRSEALGWFDPQRVAADYDLVEKYFALEKKFPATAAYTNQFLDKAVKLP